MPRRCSIWPEVRRSIAWRDRFDQSIHDESSGGLAKGKCLLTEYQTAGRGRRGRRWIRRFGSQLMMSLYWRLEEGMAAAMGLSLVVGVAWLKPCSPSVITRGLKWPNDVYAQGQAGRDPGRDVGDVRW